MNPHSTFVKLVETSSKTDIALIRGVLDSEGVRYFLQGENTMSLQGADPVVLMVSDTDVLKAVEVLTPLKLRFVESWHLEKG